MSTKEPEAVLCVGGPLQGRTMHVMHGKEFVAPLRNPVGVLDRAAASGTTLSTVRYRYFKHSIGLHTFAVWVPADWTDAVAAEVVFNMAAQAWREKLAELTRGS